MKPIIQAALLVGAVLFLGFGLWSNTFEEITPQTKASSYDGRICQFGVMVFEDQSIRCLFEDEVTHETLTSDTWNPYTMAHARP